MKTTNTCTEKEQEMQMCSGVCLFQKKCPLSRHFSLRC